LFSGILYLTVTFILFSIREKIDDSLHVSIFSRLIINTCVKFSFIRRLSAIFLSFMLIFLCLCLFLRIACILGSG